MGIRNAAWNTIKWKFMKKRLGYNNEEMKIFRNNPRNEDVLNKAPEFQKKTIIVEVVDSHVVTVNTQLEINFILMVPETY